MNPNIDAETYVNVGFFYLEKDASNVGCTVFNGPK